MLAFFIIAIVVFAIIANQLDSPCEGCNHSCMDCFDEDDWE